MTTGETAVLVGIVTASGAIFGTLGGALVNGLLSAAVERRRQRTEAERQRAEHARADAAEQRRIADEVLATLTQALDNLKPNPTMTASRIVSEWYEWSDSSLRVSAARLRDSVIRAALIDVAKGMCALQEIVDADRFASDPPEHADWALARAKVVIEVGIEYAGAAARGEAPDERAEVWYRSLRRDLDRIDGF